MPQYCFTGWTKKDFFFDCPGYARRQLFLFFQSAQTVLTISPIVEYPNNRMHNNKVFCISGSQSELIRISRDPD